MRTTFRATAIAIALGAVALRIPAYLATRHLSFDDGVYGASAVAMRAGGKPFRDVFSSQGPLHLPLVWFFDLVGLRTLDSPRLLAVASAAAMVLATWSAARALRLSTAAAALAAGLVATSGSVLWVTAPLTSDGPALALASWAVAAALWYRRSPSLRRAVIAGVLLGAALSVKSLLLGAGVAVAWVLLPERGRRLLSGAAPNWLPLGAALAVAGALSLAVALPWGLADVWDQAFRYHLEAAGSRTPLPNLRKVLATLGDRDLPLLVAGLAAGMSAVGRRRTRPGEPSASGPGDLLGRRAVGAWLVVTVLVLAAEHPLWRNHVSHLVPAAALLVAAAFDRARPVRRQAAGLAAIVAVVAVPYHVVHLSELLWPAPPGRALAAAGSDLRALPDGAQIISDDPGVVWRAGRRTPHDLVDTSILRIDSGRLTGPSLARAAARRPVCAVLVWSHRFGDLPHFPRLLEEKGYRPIARYGGAKVLFIRDACSL